MVVWLKKSPIFTEATLLKTSTTLLYPVRLMLIASIIFVEID